MDYRDKNKILYDIGDFEFINYSKDNEVIYSNRKGGFISLPFNNFNQGNSSKFQGIFYYDSENNTLIKTINSFKKEREKTIEYKDLRINWKDEEIFYFQHSIIYRTRGKIILNLDIREVYDFNPWNRNHAITKEEDKIIINYSKNDFKFFIILYSKDLKYNLIEKWVKEDYYKDVERGEFQEIYTFDAMEIFLKNDLIIGLGKTLEEAESNLKYAIENENALIKTKKKYLESIENISKRNINNELDTKTKTAYFLATSSLDSLTVNIGENTGIFAGYPWFFQFWTRDEAISVGALISQHRFNLAKRILLRQINKILDNGRLPNRFPYSELGSADGVGISFFRLFELFKKSQNVFSEKEILFLYEQLKNSIEKLLKNYYKNGLIINYEKETWMDTNETIVDSEKDNREGYCIEIQALFHNMLKFNEFLSKILKKKNNILKSSQFKKRINELFLSENDKIIVDRLDYNLNKDLTIRPNVFLAHYFSNEIFNKNIWKNTFKRSLQALWLDWGGLSSIDKNSRWYCENHTGINNKSYHRGDSWFFVNNISAISLNNIKGFNKYVKKILEASMNDILFNGAIGHASEISDSKNLSSKGCKAQAWSAATFIELVNNIFE